ncbi:hypothetical protein [Microbacterium sp. NPDC089696]|uniref:hypothetical protein n=1 Tax=Microbacterium sp. NPDC089696 TaxID=3364199 RepID=UPI00382DC66F
MRLITTASIAASLVMAASAAVPASAACSTGERAALGTCASTDGTALTISGTKQQPGGPPASGRPRNGDRPTDPAPTDPRSDLERCLDDWEFATCFERVRNQPNTPAPPPGVPAVTIADLARFAPPPLAASTEPGDVAIVGMPANFVGAASMQTVSGTLFGLPITVRFTPVGYDYTYGDGASASLSEPGRTWAALGQAQFTATPTSHVYSERGTYRADVDVRYSAEVDLSAGWFPVAGEIRTDGPARDIRVLEARTALVAHTCAENPGAPGC